MKERFKPKNKLRAYWSKKEGDLMFWSPTRQSEGGVLWSFLDHIEIDNGHGPKTLLKELNDRGFDIKTLRFSVAYKDEE